MVVNRIELTERCFLETFCLDAQWLVLRFSAIIFSKILSAPAIGILPRMFAFALHLKSETAHEAVKGSVFRPSLSYVFEDDQLSEPREMRKVAPAAFAIHAFQSAADPSRIKV